MFFKRKLKIKTWYKKKIINNKKNRKRIVKKFLKSLCIESANSGLSNTFVSYSPEFYKHYNSKFEISGVTLNEIEDFAQKNNLHYEIDCNKMLVTISWF